MRLGTWIRYGTLAAVLLVTGCNLFNPSGEGNGELTNPRREGEEFYRRGQFAKALEAFALAIEQDSTNSMAYYGYAKAAVKLYELDKLSILKDLDSTQRSGEIAFLNHDDTTLTLRLQAASRVRLVLGRLLDRDTLTQWYQYYVDSTSKKAKNDTLFEARRAFIIQYMISEDEKALAGKVGGRVKDRFPLTDFRMPATSVMLDYTAFELLYTFTRLYDLDGNDTIDDRDALMKKFKFGKQDGFNLDSLSNIAGDLENDTQATQNLNALIANTAGGLGNTAALLGLILPPADEDSGEGGTEEATTGNLDSVVSSLGDAILFYQFGDKLDNDGDGCIDEELMDEKDNDLDGYVDEDARVIPDDKPDAVDNDRSGKKDPFHALLNPTNYDSLEARAGATLYPDRPFVLGFVRKYLAATPPDNETTGNQLNTPIPLTTWVKIKKPQAEESNENLLKRLAIQKDSLAVKIPIGGPVPDSLAVKLQNAKDDVGGCWRNY